MGSKIPLAKRKTRGSAPSPCRGSGRSGRSAPPTGSPQPRVQLARRLVAVAERLLHDEAPPPPRRLLGAGPLVPVAPRCPRRSRGVSPGRRARCPPSSPPRRSRRGGRRGARRAPASGSRRARSARAPPAIPRGPGPGREEGGQLAVEALPERLARHVAGGEPEDGEGVGQEARLPQVQEGREELSLGQIPGGSEEHEGAGVGGLSTSRAVSIARHPRRMVPGCDGRTTKMRRG